jgi:hypothetical protein
MVLILPLLHWTAVKNARRIIQAESRFAVISVTRFRRRIRVNGNILRGIPGFGTDGAAMSVGTQIGKNAPN